MGVLVYKGTMPGALTPACNECGVHLCWDISHEDYGQAKDFWDQWICQECNGGKPFNKASFQSAPHRIEDGMKLP